MQKLIPIIAWAESIVPIWKHGVFVKVQLGHLFVCDFDADVISFGRQCAFYT